MILSKLQEALAEVDGQRRTLDKVESQLRSMITELSGTSFHFTPAGAKPKGPEPSRVRDQLDDIADVLRTEGHPLHINVIAERLSVATGKKVTRTMIEPGLNRHINKVKKRRIDKFAPSTYGVPEWKTDSGLPHVA